MSKQCLDVLQMQHLQELGMELKESAWMPIPKFTPNKTE